MVSVLINAPTEEPVALADVKTHSVVDDGEDDLYLESLIVVAREFVERESGLALVEQEWEERLDDFPIFDIELSRAPVRSISSVTYIDTEGVQQTLPLSELQIDVSSRPARLVPRSGGSWPSTSGEFGAVKIHYSAGYSAAGEVGYVSVPSLVKQIMKILVAHFYENRELVSAGSVNEVPMSVMHMIGLVRVVGL